MVVREVACCVSYFITPRQVLGILRVLKAVTFCSLILATISNIMYVVLLEVMADEGTRLLAGGYRDAIIRVYGMILSIVSIGIQVDNAWVVKKFSVLKWYIPRSAFIFFIAVITSSHPIHAQLNGNQNDITTSAISFQLVTSFAL
jgi:COPI associated protein